MNGLDEEQAKQIANFRYALIAPIVSRQELYPGEIAAAIDEAAKKTYQIPGSTKTRVSARTIERYLQTFRKGGYQALKPSSTPRAGTHRIPLEYLEAAASLKRENSSRSTPQIIEILERANKVPVGILRRSTVYDYFEKNGLNRQAQKKAAKAFQRFTAKHRNQRWQGDTCHILHLPTGPKKSQKVYLMAWVDDHSRMIPHAQCYFEEKGYALEDCLKKAMIKWGIPEQIHVDNGAIYSSTHLQSVCGQLSVKLSHSRPYKPQGRGKIERFFHFVQSSFLPEIEVLLREATLSLNDLNDYLFVWIDKHYHEKIHSATKQKPIVRFQSDSHPIRNLDFAQIEDAFLVETTRSVDKTSVFSLHSHLFQVDLALARKKVQVRYNPYDLSTTQVYYGGERYPDAALLEVPETIDFAAQQPPVSTEAPPSSGLNLLLLLEKERQQETISYPKQTHEEET